MLARAAVYPSYASVFSANMNIRLRRVLWDYQLLGPKIAPTTGVSPGSAFAMAELTACGLDVSLRFVLQRPMIELVFARRHCYGARSCNLCLRSRRDGSTLVDMRS